MLHGVVKFFDQARGYGFIARDDGGADVFVHITAVTSPLIKNQRVEFVLGANMRDGRNGRAPAVNVRVVC